MPLDRHIASVADLHTAQEAALLAQHARAAAAGAAPGRVKPEPGRVQGQPGSSSNRLPHSVPGSSNGRQQAGAVPKPEPGSRPAAGPSSAPVHRLDLTSSSSSDALLSFLPGSSSAQPGPQRPLSAAQGFDADDLGPEETVLPQFPPSTAPSTAPGGGSTQPGAQQHMSTAEAFNADDVEAPPEVLEELEVRLHRAAADGAAPQALQEVGVDALGRSLQPDEADEGEGAPPEVLEELEVCLSIGAALSPEACDRTSSPCCAICQLAELMHVMLTACSHKAWLGCMQHCGKAMLSVQELRPPTARSHPMCAQPHLQRGAKRADHVLCCALCRGYWRAWMPRTSRRLSTHQGAHCAATCCTTRSWASAGCASARSSPGGCEVASWPVSSTCTARASAMPSSQLRAAADSNWQGETGARCCPGALCAV